MAHLKNSVTASQGARILAYLQAGNPLTAIQALDLFGCNRLAARVGDLRNEGHNIVTATIQVTNREGGICRVAEYRLIQGGAQ